MITRAHIVAKKSATDTTERDEIIPVPTPKSYARPGWYPAAYRITWDEDTREYRIALTKLERQG
jgi:nicotinic acid mononucleotide adenylyltransferase